MADPVVDAGRPRETITDLIARLCPDGVEYRALGTLGRRNKGTSITAAKMKILSLSPGPIRIFAGGQTIADVREDSVPAKDVVRVPSIIVKSRGHIGFCYYEQPFTHKSELWSYSIDAPEVDQKFVYYFLLTKIAELQETARATSVKLPQLSVKDTDNLRIPIPPLVVQREIVRILDLFTTLEAELEGRRKQYAYYRNQLLDYPKPDAESSLSLYLSLSKRHVTWSTLGEISTKVSSGGTPLASRRDYYHEGTIPWLRTQEVRFSDIWNTDVLITEKAIQHTSAKWIPANCVIIAISGATAARSAINKIRLTTNQHCCNLEIDPQTAEYRYVFHWVSSRYEQLKSLGQGARSDLNSTLIKNFPIPIPLLAEQRRIVDILDKFDHLVNDLTSGLPAEITARRQQYEHYRNQLLTFTEKP